MPRLLPENHLAWDLWSICSQHDRPVGEATISSISTGSVLEICREYDATHDDFKKILLIERTILPVWKDRLALKLETIRNKK